MQQVCCAAQFHSLANIPLPIEPRKRFTWIFSAEKPLDRALPLTIDPSGIHMRQYGQTDYMAGSPPHIDPAAAFDDFEEDHSIWEEHVWPLIATRIPQFEAIRVTSSWAGHYAYNVLDHNAVLGPHSQISNFIFANGFLDMACNNRLRLGAALPSLFCMGTIARWISPASAISGVENLRPLLETAII